jgi:hypothetical protein
MIKSVGNELYWYYDNNSIVGIYMSRKLRILIFLLFTTVLLLCKYSHFTAGDGRIDLYIYAALLLSLCFFAQFPFASASFTITYNYEKFFVFIAIGFCNMMAIMIVPALISMHLHFSFTTLLLIYLLSLFLIYSIYKPERIFQRQESPNPPDTTPYASLLFFILFAVTVYLSIYYGGWLYGDWTWHGSYIRKLKELPALTFNNYIVADIKLPLYGHCLWHVCMAFLVFLTNLDTTFFWVNLLLVMVLIKISVFYLLSKALFQKAYWAQISTIIFLLIGSLLGIEIPAGLLPSFLNTWHMDTSAYPSAVARDILLVFLLAYIFNFVATRKISRKELFFLSIIICLTHYYYVFHIVLILGSLFLLCLCIKNEETKFYVHMATRNFWIFMPSLSYAVVFMILFGVPAVNPSYTTPAAAGPPYDKVVQYIGRTALPYIDPWNGLLRNPFHAVLLLSLIPFILLTKRKTARIWELYLIAVTVIICFIFFNPPLLYLIQKLNPGMDRVFRLVEVLPVILIFAGFLYKLVEERNYIPKWLHDALLYLAIFLLLPTIILWHQKIIFNATIWNEQAAKVVPWKKTVETVIPPGSRVVISPDTIWVWTTMFPHYLYIHPYTACVPANYDPAFRITTWRNFFGSPITHEAFNEFIKSGMEYIIMSQKTYNEKYNDWGALQKYCGNPIIIKELNLVVFKIHSQ